MKQDRVKGGDENDIKKIRHGRMEPEVNQPREGGSEPDPPSPYEDKVLPLASWSATARDASYSWHPALNSIEDILVAQISEPSIIVDIIERAGMNPGTIPRGHGAAATLWHGALRRGWMTGGQEKICEILSQANKIEPSTEIQNLIGAYCIKR
jgi:hypothetical protein